MRLSRALLSVAALSYACGFDEPPPVSCDALTFDDPSPSACHGQYCGACTSSTSCMDLEACMAGTCGSCGNDADCGPARHCRAGFCVGEPRTWELGVAPKDWQTILADPYQEIFVPCTLAVGGQRFDDGCRVRLRGGTSRDYRKRSLRVTYPEMTPHPGYSRKINLRAEYNDPTFLRNYLALELFRRYTKIPTPRVRFVRLTLNGEPYGLMAEVERVGDSFLKRNGWSTIPSLYEADPLPDLFRQNATSLIPLPTPALYAQAYAKSNGVPGDTSDLVELIEQKLWPDYEEGTTTRTTQAVDVEGLTDYLAVMGALQSLDHVRKNYYLSPQNGRWQMVPWDLDLTFGCLANDEAGNTLCPTLVSDATAMSGMIPPGLDVAYPAEGHINLLIHLLLTDPQHSGRFKCRACAVVDSPFWQTRLPQLVDELAGALRPEVEADPRDLNASVADFDAAIRDLKAFLPARAAHLRQALQCSGS